MIVTGPHVVEWVAKRANDFGNFGAAVGIGVARDTPIHGTTVTRHEIIGGVVFNEFNGVNIAMHTAAVPGSGWLTRTALWHFFEYPFNQAKVRRITVPIGEGNTVAQRLVEGVGFRLETELADAHPTGSLLLYVMRRADCRWLEKRDHHERMAA